MILNVHPLGTLRVFESVAVWRHHRYWLVPHSTPNELQGSIPGMPKCRRVMGSTYSNFPLSLSFYSFIFFPFFFVFLLSSFQFLLVPFLLWDLSKRLSLEPLPIAIPIQNRIDFNNRQDVNKPALDPHAKHNWHASLLRVASECIWNEPPSTSHCTRQNSWQKTYHSRNHL